MSPIAFVQFERFRRRDFVHAVQLPGELLQLRKVAKPDLLRQLRRAGRGLRVEQIESQAQGACNGDPGADGHGRLASFDAMQRDPREAGSLGRRDGGYPLALAGGANTLPQERKTLLVGRRNERSGSHYVAHNRQNGVFVNYEKHNCQTCLTGTDVSPRGRARVIPGSRSFLDHVSSLASP